MTLLPPLTSPIQVVCGSATETVAEVYLRFSAASRHGDDLQIFGKGPYCELGRTLPYRFAFQRLEDRLWRAQIVDPCFWSPTFPARYRLEPSVLADPPDGGPFEFGLRHFGVQQNCFRLNRRRWVWRAFARDSRDPALTTADEQALCADCRDQGLSLLLNGVPPRSLLQATSRHGLMTAIRFAEEDCAAALAALRSVGDWPSWSMAIFPATTQFDRAALRAAAPNLVIGADLGDATTTSHLEWCDWLFVPAHSETIERAAISGGRVLPIVAVGSSPENSLDAEQIRRNCELLQARLAPKFDLAGYVV